MSASTASKGDGENGRCDVCDNEFGDECHTPQFGVLQGHWGSSSTHPGEHYSVRLCESCFFYVLASLRRQRMVNRLFDDDPPEETGEFGLVGRDAEL